MALVDDRRDIPKKQPVCIIKIEIVLFFYGIFSYLCIKSQISLRAWSFSRNRLDILTSERDWALLASQVRDLCTVVFRTSRLSLTSFFKCRIFCCWPKISASDLFNFVWNETEVNQEKKDLHFHEIFREIWFHEIFHEIWFHEIFQGNYNFWYPIHHYIGNSCITRRRVLLGKKCTDI